MSEQSFQPAADFLNLLSTLPDGLELGVRVLNLEGQRNVGEVKLGALMRHIGDRGPLETQEDAEGAEGVGPVFASRVLEALMQRGFVRGGVLRPDVLEALKAGEVPEAVEDELPEDELVEEELAEEALVDEPSTQPPRLVTGLLRRATGPSGLALALLIEGALRLGSGAALGEIDALMGQLIRRTTGLEGLMLALIAAPDALQAARERLARELGLERPDPGMIDAFSPERFEARLALEVPRLPLALLADLSGPDALFGATGDILDLLKRLAKGDLSAAKDVVDGKLPPGLDPALISKLVGQAKELLEKAKGAEGAAPAKPATGSAPATAPAATPTTPPASGGAADSPAATPKAGATAESAKTPSDDESTRPDRVAKEKPPEGTLYRISVHTITCEEVEGQLFGALFDDQISYVVDGHAYFNQAPTTVPIRFVSALHRDVAKGDVLSSLAERIPPGKSNSHLLTLDEAVIVNKRPIRGKSSLGQKLLSVANAPFALPDFKFTSFTLTLFENDSDGQDRVEKAFKLAQRLIAKLAPGKLGAAAKILADTDAIAELGRLIAELLADKDERIGSWSVDFTDADLEKLIKKGKFIKAQGFEYIVIAKSGPKQFSSSQGAKYFLELRLERIVAAATKPKR